MRAATFQGSDKPLSVQEIPTPKPGPGQLLLKVKACGICGSDLHAYQVAMSAVGNPFGHEFSGEVAAIGEGVSDEWQISDRAIALGAMACGECGPCQQGQFEECENVQMTGFSYPGAYAEYVITQAALTTPVVDGIEHSQAALVEPLCVGLTAYRDCELRPGGNVLIIGGGIIGIAVAKWARFFGAEHIVVSDLDSARLGRAKLEGATDIIDAGQNSDAVQAFQNLTGTSPDVIIECVGRPMLQHLIDIAPPACRIVSVGGAMEPDSFVPLTATQKKIQLVFSFGYRIEDFEFIMRMLASKRVETNHLISRSVSLDEVPEAFAGLMQPNGHCKVMINP